MAKRLPRRVVWLVTILCVLLLGGVVAARYVYTDGLKPVSNSQTTQIFTVKSGSSVDQIATELEEAKLIKSAWAFKLYLHSKELTNRLQAGTYAFSPSDGTKSIVATMTKGKVTTKLVTIYPGRRIDQVRADFINDGFSPEQVDAALNPARYRSLPALAYKPANVKSLEGLLWPDSFQKDATTDPAHIIRQSLLAMGEHLTPDIQAAFAKRGLTTYEGLILASILEQEVAKPADQAQAAQVFFSRMQSGSKLEADSTARYGAILAGEEPSLTFESAYNTYTNEGLPPTPISSISQTSLVAAARPAKTTWLYFVSGDNGKTYFSRTLEEHEALTEKYCHRLCQQ